jgi:hypothetical protein
MSDELESKVSDDDETQDEDVEAHRRHRGATDDGASSEDSDDDFEAHRKHGGA